MAYRMQTDKTEAQTRRQIATEFERWNNQSRNATGLYDFPAPESIGSAEAVVRFTLRGQPVVMRCTSQPHYRLNLRCLFYAIEAMRMNEKRGIGDTLREAYAMLSAPKTKRDPYEVLGVRSDAPLGVIEASYKALTKERHPDAGGTDEGMTEINLALEAIKAERKVTA